MPEADSTRDATRVARMTEALTQELAATRALRDCLATERAALGARAAGALNSAIETKAVAIERVRAASGLRERCLHEAGCAPTAAGLRGFAAAYGTQAQATDLLSLATELVAEAEALRRDNEVNGRVLEVSQQATGWLLRVLRGDSAGPRLYGPDGGRTSNAGSAPLARV